MAPLSLMTVQELATYLNGMYTVGTLYRMACEGRIPCRRKPARLRFLKEEIDEWLKPAPTQAPAPIVAPHEQPGYISRFQSARARLSSLKTEDTNFSRRLLETKGAG